MTAEISNRLRLMLIIALSIIAGLVRTATATCAGCVELNVLTFDKVLTRFPVTIVKFDIAYPYGDKHEAYSQFASDVAQRVDDLLVAVVGIKDYGEKDNENLGKRFSVGTIYPVIKLFLNGRTDTPIDYPSGHEISVENLKQFVRQNSNIYIGLDGCVQEFDVLAQQFTAAESAEQAEAIIRQMEDAISGIQATEPLKLKTANIYLMLMRRMQEKGADFMRTESQRVTQLLAGKVAAAKRTELRLRLNILEAFRTLTDVNVIPDRNGEL